MYDEAMANVLERSDLKSVIDAIRRREAEIRDLGVTALYIYGSRARGDHEPDSDLDVMVEYERGHFSVLELVGVQHIIGDDTGLEVHALTRGCYGPENFKSLQQDLVRVF